MVVVLVDEAGQVMRLDLAELAAAGLVNEHRRFSIAHLAVGQHALEPRDLVISFSADFRWPYSQRPTYNQPAAR